MKTRAHTRRKANGDTENGRARQESGRGEELPRVNREEKEKEERGEVIPSFVDPLSPPPGLVSRVPPPTPPSARNLHRHTNRRNAHHEPFRNESNVHLQAVAVGACSAAEGKSEQERQREGQGRYRRERKKKGGGTVGGLRVEG